MNMRNAVPILMIAVALSGCTLFRKSQAPDEFAVARNAPLIIPPDFTLTATIGIRSTAGDPDTRVIDKGNVTTAILNTPQRDGQVASAQVPQ
jgi:PBP1b-binding outer membrane lipoprotein LpoB